MMEIAGLIGLGFGFALLLLLAWAIDGFHNDRARIDREHLRWLEECRKTGNYGDER